MIDGRLVAGYLRLATPGHTVAPGGAVDDLVARLRELVLARVGEAAAAALEDERAGPEAWSRVARAIEEAGRRDPAFAREATRLCDELARRGAQPVPWPAESVTCPQCGHLTRSGHAFCDHCGIFLEWASSSVPAPTGSPAPPAHRSEPPAPVEASASTLEMSGGDESGRRVAQAIIDQALSTYVQRGRLLFNPPEQMRQGRTERVRVAIAQHGGLDPQLRALAPGTEDALIEDLETTPFMEVDLQGPAFSIVSLQAGDTAEQLLRPTALWQFDVTPERGGTHSLHLRVAMRVPLPDRDERVSLPALERTVRVRVDPAYGGRRFIRAHWQWVLATAAGLGGAVGAWIRLFQD
ncbi:zinc ribbon domain-containing protein [Nocardioides sediminis]|uniref:zinc ribbon domain-containing protein n=1 Tax=Nocardioides sediminis TaxID=433648 RepID=UPI00131F3ED1|nr:zinc ribbon domain-containing protein [Nocardioides sediminis]